MMSNLHSFVFVIGILFGLHLVSYPCEGAISIINGDKIRFAEPGENVVIEWDLGTPVSNAKFRLWRFHSVGEETIARILDDGDVIYPGSLPGVHVTKPATLILKNVSDIYNGTYQFQFFSKTASTETSSVAVFVAARPTVTINCSTPTIVNEGDDVRCLCKGEGGNPPANVTWYKDGVQIRGLKDEQKPLTLTNIDKTASGTYKCVTQSYTLKDEKSIEVLVHYTKAPALISLTSTPERAIIGKTVVITCEAIAVPVPSYTIIHNDTEVVSTKTTYIINVVKYSDTGSYKCVAKNKLGNSSMNYYLSVVVIRTTSAPKTKIFATEKATCNKSNDGTKWYMIVVSLLSGFIIGNIFSFIFVCSRRWCRNGRKPQSNHEPETSKVDSFYQDLDLTKMSSEDNYQSLKVNSDRNDADYENQTDLTYTELNKVRDVENNYQSLT